MISEILDAIRYHTSGRAEMTLLEKVIYLADYIEPGSKFPGVDEVREMAEKNLNKALIQADPKYDSIFTEKNNRFSLIHLYTYNDLN